MHLKHFGLGTEPFAAVFQPNFFYRGFQHGAALGFLAQAFDIGRPALALIGPPGGGKSAVLRYAIDRHRGGGRLGLVDGLPREPVALLGAVLGAFGFGAIEAGHAELRNLLSVFVVQARRNRQKVVLQVRDPGLPSPEVADELRWMIHSIAPDGEFQLVLSGGESLERLLDSPRLEPLAREFRDRHHLSSLGERETVDYLHFRLAAAGAAAPEQILPDESGLAIHESAGGIVRSINRLAAAALERAGRAGAAGVDLETVRASAESLGMTTGAEVGASGFRLDVRLDEAPYMKFPLGLCKVLIGRHAHNEIRLRDGSVSRHHAMILPDGDRWVVVDLNSTNGTVLNGEPVQQARLSDGDRLGVGRFVIEFRGQGAAGAVPADEPDMRRTVVLTKPQPETGLSRIPRRGTS
jgi:type II secretory pathway predicted ATPase ExeA